MRTTFLLLFFTGICSLVSATDFQVTSGADSGPGTLRQAILDANLDTNSPHTITITNDVKTITVSAALPAPSKAMTIDGGTSGVVIDGSAIAGSNVLAYSIVTVNFHNLIFNNALLSIGSASGSPAVGSGVGIARNCTFRNGIAGAVKVSSLFKAINCQFYNNTMNATANGVAIRGLSSANSVYLDSCIIRENNSTGANGGAAIYIIGNNPASKLEVRNSILYNNTNATTGTNYGGGIASGGETIIHNSAIYGNSAKRGGGLVLLNGGTLKKSKLTITNSTFSENNATEVGGGICILGASTDVTDSISITNTTISGNHSAGATVDGGGINIGQGASSPWILRMSLNNCTVTKNTSSNTSGSGAGIGRTNSGNIRLWINYSIVAGNNPESTNIGRDITSSVGWLASSTGRNIYGGVPSWGDSERLGNINLNDGTTGNELVALTDIMTLTLADNGGTSALPDGSFVKTHALFENSYALDPVTADFGMQLTDQRGFDRDEMPDIGAYEYIPTTRLIYLPSNNHFSIVNRHLQVTDNGIVEIISVSGRILLKSKVKSGDQIALPKGLSIVKFSTEKGRFIQKVIL